MLIRASMLSVSSGQEPSPVVLGRSSSQVGRALRRAGSTADAPDAVIGGNVFADLVAAVLVDQDDPLAELREVVQLVQQLLRPERTRVPEFAVVWQLRL